MMRAGRGIDAMTAGAAGFGRGVANLHKNRKRLPDVASALRPAMTDWTRGMVQDRVVEAADLLKLLPPVRLSGRFSTWPGHPARLRRPGRRERGPDAPAAEPRSRGRAGIGNVWQTRPVFS